MVRASRAYLEPIVITKDGINDTIECRRGEDVLERQVPALDGGSWEFLRPTSPKSGCRRQGR